MDTSREEESEPQSNYAIRTGKLVEKFLPPGPADQFPIVTRTLRDLIEKRHNRRALILLLVVMATATAVGKAAPWSRYSLVTFIFIPLTELIRKYFWWIEVIGLTLLFILLLSTKKGKKHKVKALKDDYKEARRQTRGMLGQAALYEEQLFREGSENWSWWQRVQSCIVFGVVHLYNLIVPLSLTPALTIGGASLMFIYLREFRRTQDRQAAVVEAAVTHRAYNKYAFWLMFLSIPWSFLYPYIAGTPS